MTQGMNKFKHRKLGNKNLKVLSSPYSIIDKDSGVQQTYCSKEEFDQALQAYKLGFNCDIDESDFNKQVNS